MDTYRIRWAVVEQRKLCIAERKYRLAWILPFYFPIGPWREGENWAEGDIAHDKRLREPLPRTKYIA